MSFPEAAAISTTITAAPIYNNAQIMYYIVAQSTLATLQVFQTVMKAV